MPTNMKKLKRIAKTSFQGLSLGEAKKGVFDSLLVAAENNRSGLGNYNVGKGRGLRVTARTTGASKSIEAEVDKPLGLTLGQKPGVNPNIFHHSCGWMWECSKGRA